METLLASIMKELPANALITAAIVPIFQWLKRSPYVTVLTEKTAFALSGVVALLTSVGIHFSFDASGDVLQITGLLAFVTDVPRQWIMQHWGHRAYRALELTGGKA
jgi:hypothetical protein